MYRVWLLLPTLLAAQHSVSYQADLHYEHEIIHANNAQLQDDSQNLFTLYNQADYRFESDMIALNLQGRANVKLLQDGYETPYYNKYYTLDDPGKALVSMASIDLFAKAGALSLGRNIVDMPWMHGSVDSVIYYYEGDAGALRLFWALNYYELQPSYYREHEGINHDSGIMGIYYKTPSAFEKLEAQLYYYRLDTFRDIGGMELSYALGEVLVNAAYARSDNLEHNSKPVEYYGRLWLQTLLGKESELEIGASKTGDVGITYMFTFGAHPFTPFYLSNEINRPRAQNYYLKLFSLHNRFYFEAIGGLTDYFDDALSRRGVRKAWMRAFEVDAYLGYRFGKNVSVELGAMHKRADEADIVSFDQTLLKCDLKVNWP